MLERQELYCHNCGKYVQFSIDTELDGNHVLTCPDCGHEHCRVVRHGRVTDIRWGQRNTQIPTYQIAGSITTSSTAAYTVMLDTSSYVRDSWYNASTTSTGTTF